MTTSNEDGASDGVFGVQNWLPTYRDPREFSGTLKTPSNIQEKSIYLNSNV